MTVCGYFREKVMRMYDVANAGRSGTALCVLPQKSLTPKIFHTKRFSSKIPRKYRWGLTEIWQMVLVSKFYLHSVVGRVVNCTGVIYGVRTSLFLTSQRMPSRYNALTNVCNFKIFWRGMYLCWYFWFDILSAQRCW